MCAHNPETAFGRITPALSPSGGLLLPGVHYGDWVGVRLDADPVVDCAAQLLLAPEVTLLRLDRDMTEQKLDLIQFAAG